MGRSGVERCRLLRNPAKMDGEREDYFIRDESVLRIKNSEAVTPERRIIRAK